MAAVAVARGNLDGNNPYAAPSVVVADVVQAPQAIHIAGRWRRFFNWLVDKVAIMLVSVVFFGLIYAIGDDAVVAWLDGMNRVEEYVSGLPIYVGYYLVMEGLFGITVGKLCTGTRVVDENGHAIGFRQALLRSLCRLIPFDAFSVLMSDDRTIRAWHDSLPRTYVVLRKAAAQGAAPAAA